MPKEKPILFSTPMVQAILAGNKTEKKIYKSSYKELSENEVLAMRIANGVIVNAELGCWEWQRARNKDGYGTMTKDHRTFLVTRLVHTLAHGEIPDGKHVLHDCDNPCCCNPDHLHLGTRSDNMQECYARGRSKIKPVSFKGENNGSARLSRRDIPEIRQAVLNGDKQHVIASIYGVSQAQISNIVRGREWAHVG